MRTLFTAALIAAATVSPALAQEDAPFTGPRVEALVGYDRINPGDNFDAKADGIVYGGAIGYDFQLGGAVLGVEGEVSGSNTNTTNTGLIAAGDRFETKLSRDLYAGVRLGFAVAPKTLLYVKGGYTNAGVNTYYTPAVGTMGKSKLNADGYRLGAGIEQKFALFGPSGFVKAEYRYSNYSGLNTAVAATTQSIDLDRHQVVAGVGVRF